MRGFTKKAMALGLTAGMIAGTMLTGCGGSSSENDQFQYMIATAVDNGFYTEYEDMPVVKYWLDMDWDADGDGETKKVNIDIIAPASTESGSDMINTLLATGEYPDILDVTMCSETPLQMYEEGICQDITDYVLEYMPNYVNWLNDNGYYDRLTVNIDGEQRFLQLYGVGDTTSDMWGGYVYRRDWIVKYGTNPETGEPFEGGYDEDGIWSDNVVFPSGEVDPIYISDWEWMMEIFTKAMDDLGITDGYCTQIYYAGDIATGEFETGFGFGCSGTYLNEDNEAVYGGYSDGMRAYLECMNTWYENGWVDKTFDERSSDIFFQIDTPTIYAGKCGIWWGMASQLGNGLDTGDELTSGIYVQGAPQPINDIYGTDECKYKNPTTYYSDPLVSGGVIFTDKIEGKDVATLFTAIDYLYSYEGGLLHFYGFSREQQAEIQDEFYNEHGLEDGAYYIDEDGTVIVNTARDAEDGLEDAICGKRLVGIAIKDANTGENANVRYSYDLWKKYPNTGMITSDISSQITSDQSQEVSTISAEVQPFSAAELPKFIKGEYDINDDAQWNAYCDQLREYGADKQAQYINEALGK